MKGFWLIVRYYKRGQTILLVKSLVSQCQTIQDSGLVTLSIDSNTFQIYCDNQTDGGGWLKILSRKDGSVDFASPLWNQFASHGVGSFSGEFFLALNYIHLITKYGPKELLVEMRDGTDYAFAYYESFQVEDAANLFKLKVSGYDPASTAGDGLSAHNDQSWSSPDSDNDISGRHCAFDLQASWWFHGCHDSNPLGQYGADGQIKADSWVPFKGSTTALDAISFKIRTKRCNTSYGQSCLKCETNYYLCTDPFSGRVDCCSTSINSCQEATATGIWDIVVSGTTFRVWCETDFEGGGWTSILRRKDGSFDFSSTNWKQFSQYGAGDPTGEFISSLHLMHLLTSVYVMELHVALVKSGTSVFAKYGSFSVNSQTLKHALSIAQYDPLSTGGDSLTTKSNGATWSSPDLDTSGNGCSGTFKSSFWFARNCASANPLGLYGSLTSLIGTFWESFQGLNVSLDYIEFLIRPNICLVGPSKTCTNCAHGLYICATKNEGTACCEAPLSSCQEAQYTGSYHLLYKGTLMLVRCQVNGNEMPWTTILRRESGIVNFEIALWNDYAHNGVGNVGSDFFLALDSIHLLTEQGDMELLVQMQDGANSASARYRLFKVEDQSTNYRLTVEGYDSSSSGGDALVEHTGMAFSTIDTDNDLSAGSCAISRGGAFWYNDCYDTNPLGIYGVTGVKGIQWQRWKVAPLDYISFSIRRNLCAKGTCNSCTQCKTGYYLCTAQSGLIECCTQLISSCEAVTHSGIYQIGIQGNTYTVYCEVTASYGVLTQLLSRENGSVDDFATVSFDDFAYKGHGSVAGGDYILPLQFWHALSTSQSYELVIFTSYGGTQAKAVYTDFHVCSYSEGYTLTLDGYDAFSSLPDDLSLASGNKFSAHDIDSTPGLCVTANNMPFWLPSSCGNVNPLGKYGATISQQGIYWESRTGCCDSLTKIAFGARLSHCTQGAGLSCTACQSNFFLNKIGSKSVCTAYCDKTICSQCNLNNPLVCEGECADGYYLEQATHTCQKCHDLCKKCSSSSSSPCSECVPDAYFIDDSCHYSCPQQYYALPTNECIPCPFSNCQSCTSTECVICEDGFYMHNGACTSPCPDPFYSDETTKTCLPCATGCTSCFGPSLNECDSCDSATHIFDYPSNCLNYCNAGLYYDSTLLSCESCHTTCTLCYGPGQDQCEGCITGRLLLQNSCAICEDSPGLITHPSDPSQCLQICGDGHFYGINECDDGNLVNGDGCDSLCTIEPDYDCSCLAVNGLSDCKHTLFPLVKSAIVDSSLMLTLYFTEPIILTCNVVNSDFNFTITGPSNYIFQVNLDPTSITHAITSLSGRLQIESNLYGNFTQSLQIMILSQNKFRDLDGNSLRTSWLTADLPAYQYYTEAELITIQTMVNTFDTSSYRGVIVDFSLFFFILIFSGVLWSLANTVQLMSFLPLVNVFMPYNLKKLFHIFGFINMDVQIIQATLQNYLFGTEKITSEPYNQRYEQIRFQSKLLTYNVSFLLALWGFMLSMLPLFVILRCLLPLPRIQRCTLKILQSYKYNTFLVLLVQSFLELYMSAILNLFSVICCFNSQLTFSSWYEAASTLLAMFFFFILTWLPLLLHKILSVPIIELKSDKFKQQFGALITDLKISGEGRAGVVQFFSIFIFRRMAFILILVFLVNHPFIQLILLILQSFMMLIYLAVVRPFKHSKKMKLEILNQCLLLLCIICLGALYFRSVYLHAKYIGWLAVLIAATCIIINILCILPYDVQHFCKRCKERCRSKASKQKRFKVKLSELKLAWNKTQNLSIRMTPRRASSRKVLIHPQTAFRQNSAHRNTPPSQSKHERFMSQQLDSHPPLGRIGTRNMLYV